MDDPCLTVENAKGVEYMSSPVSEGRSARSLGLRDWCVWITDSCVIGKRSKAMGLVDLRATVIVNNGSIKNPSEFLGNTYEDCYGRSLAPNIHNRLILFIFVLILSLILTDKILL